MELEKEFIEKHNLTDDQVKDINAFGKSDADAKIAEAKKGFEGKANEDATAILDGAAKAVTEVTGVAIEKGEKIAEFINRSWDSFSAKGQKELTDAKADYDEKVKNFEGDPETKKELTKAKADLDAALLKYADYDTIKEAAEKLPELQESHAKMKLEVSFGQIKPQFPDTVNQYEAAARWKEFKDGVLKDNTIELVDGVPVAIDKENKHKQTKLSELMAKDETLTALLAGRTQKGPNSTEDKLEKIEGVPFDVPEKADGPTRSKLIREYLAEKGITTTNVEYANKFKAINDKILAHGTVAV